MSPGRRDADGRMQAGGTWESLVDRQIREAQERGDFDGLRLHGKPLELPDDRHAGDLAMAFQLLRNEGLAPPWIEADKEARALLAERDRLLERASRSSRVMESQFRREMMTLVERHNDAVCRLNLDAPAVRLHRRPLVLDEQLARLDAALR